MNFAKLAQGFGALLYAGAVAVASGALPVTPTYAWIPAFVGAMLRTFTDSNAISKPQ